MTSPDVRPRAADPIAAFFDDLSGRDFEPLLARVRGSIRFDVLDGERRSHWLVAIDRGHISVSRRHDAADAVVSTRASVLDGVVTGHVNTMAAVLRGELSVDGDLHLLLMFDRLNPGPPGSRRPTGPEGGTR